MKNAATLSAFVLGAFLAAGAPLVCGQQSSEPYSPSRSNNSSPNPGNNGKQSAEDSSQWQHDSSRSISDSRAKHDMRDAGRETKNATRDAGRSAKEGTKHAYHSSKRDAQKAASKTKNTAKGAVNGGKAGAKQPTKPPE